MKITIAIDTEKPNAHPLELVNELINELIALSEQDKTSNQIGWTTDSGSYIALQRNWNGPLLTRD